MLPQLRTYLLDRWSDLPLGGPRPKSLEFLVQATGIGKLCFYIFPNDAAEPHWVAKLRRSPSENDLLRREYDLIGQLRRDGSDFVRATVPGPLLESHIAGHLVVIEPYLRGRAMDGLLANPGGQAEGQVAGYLDLALGWLLRCQQETPHHRGRLSEQQLQVHFFEPIARLQTTARLTSGEADFLDRLTRRISRLAALPLPLGFKHGDFQPGNVLLGGELPQIIDWEFGVPTALPLLDVFGFLLRTRARSLGLEEMDGDLEDYLVDFDAVFFGGDSFSRHTVTYVERARQSLEIDPEWAPILFAMFIVTEANKYDSLLRGRAQRGYLYLLHNRTNQFGGSYADQLGRQKNIWLLGHLAQAESQLSIVGPERASPNEHAEESAKVLAVTRSAAPENRD